MPVELVTVAADHDVVERAHAEEDLQVLERAREAAPRQLLGHEAGDVLAGKPHPPLRRQVEAGHQVEQRGLAGAIRSDDREHQARLDRQAHVVDGLHAAEGDRQVLGGQDGHARLADNALASAGTMPARRKIITPMMIRPSTMCS